MTRMRFTPFFFGFLALLIDCAPLEPLVANTCGNGVVDANEDCDAFPKGQCGAPSSGASQCRLLCGTQPGGEALTCPDGWGCSVSGFCRQPTGAFEGAGDPVSAGVTTMLVGDFDGDGKKDVLGSSGPISKGRIHYFNGSSAPQVVVLPGVLAAPTVRDFDGDGRSDIAFGYTFRGTREAADNSLEPEFQSGYAVMVGQPDRAVVTKLFPSFTAPSFDALLVPLSSTKAADLPVSAVANPVLAAATIQSKATGAPITVLTSVDGDLTDQTLGRHFAQPLPGPITELVGDPISALIFDQNAASTCGEVVVAFKTGRILVYSPCKKGGGAAGLIAWSNDAPKELTVPGATITGVFVADVDDDTHQDIIVGINAGGTSKVRIAYGTGTDFIPLADASDDLTDVPLASGNLDRDRRIDFVVPGGILFSTKVKTTPLPNDGGAGDGGDASAPPPPPVETAEQTAARRKALVWINVPAPTKRWTIARIADVNRDGLPDVIGASRYEPDIDVLEGTQSIDLHPFTIPTTGAVTHLAVGDFDFDSNDDIGFVQARPASTESDVAIAYGRALAMPPEAPRTAGRLDGIRQVFATGSGLNLTSATAVPGSALPTFSVAILLSSGERQPVAPLLFALAPSLGMVRTELTTRALVAPSNATGKVDLIGLIARNDYRVLNGSRAGAPSYAVWVAPGTGSVAFDKPQLAVPLQSLTAVDRSTDSFLVQMVAGDLDGDKNAEIVSLAPDASGAGAVMYLIHPSMQQTSLPTPRPIPDRAVPPGGRAQLIDVDGDGNDDLVAVLRDTKTNLLQVNVFFGDGKGNLAIPGMAIALPVPAGAAATEYGAVGFTQITTGGAAVGAKGRRRELAIVTPRHLFLAFVGADRSVAFPAAAVPSPFTNIQTGSAVVAGDFDGDGVEDLAVADQGSIRIARQKARLP